MLPIHFFTIVCNGQPFIRHHFEVFRRLSVPWHWHVIEGVAALRHDTAWSAGRGGAIPDEFKSSPLSNDGTTEYLDSIQKRAPGQVTIYRKDRGQLWDGKREMVTAPLANIRSPALFWQVDADELWTIAQFEATHRLFAAHPDKSAARFACRFFFGP